MSTFAEVNRVRVTFIPASIRRADGSPPGDRFISKSRRGPCGASRPDGDLVKVMSWYDNEWGYANQTMVVVMAQKGVYGYAIAHAAR
jgi:hypothetical protein